MSRYATLDPRDEVEIPPYPNLPPMTTIGGVAMPLAPDDLAGTGVESSVLSGLVLKWASTVPQFNTNWAAQQLRLPLTLVVELLEGLRNQHFLEVLGQSGLVGYRFALTQRGRDQAHRLLEISGYIGPAPVSLEAYTAMIEWQVAQFPKIVPEYVAESLSELVLHDEHSLIAGLAVSSGRSLFLFGPSGNGKTSIGRMLHSSLRGELWVPYALSLENSIIRVFDGQCHQLADPTEEPSTQSDQRWVRIKRPMIVVGGELTLDSVDLSFSRVQRYYEAPVQLKANGGLLLIDDFGRQKFDPHALLNRWIIPLEHNVDTLTLDTGQKIQVPFRQMLIISTNLDPNNTMDPAFLRRMGYRINLESPTPEHFARIFARCAQKSGFLVRPSLIARVLNRYQAEGRELRCSDPRDLVERVHDICRYQGKPAVLSETNLDLAWDGYFGTTSLPETQ